MTDDSVPARIRDYLEKTGPTPIPWSQVPLEICIEIARLRTAFAVANGRIERLQARQRLGEAGGMGDSGEGLDGAPRASGRAGNGQ
jgi:hypothetical protein